MSAAPQTAAPGIFPWFDPRSPIHTCLAEREAAWLSETGVPGMPPTLVWCLPGCLPWNVANLATLCLQDEAEASAPDWGTDQKPLAAQPEIHHVGPKALQTLARLRSARPGAQGRVRLPLARQQTANSPHRRGFRKHSPRRPRVDGISLRDANPLPEEERGLARPMVEPLRRGR